ncbi:MAG: ABC transporter substrate-binding protein [Vulcanimicrobiaceae bacterium]
MKRTRQRSISVVLFLAMLPLTARAVDLHARLPQSIVRAGVLRIGSDISYAPLEFYAGSSKRVQGFDYDLAQELGKHLGVRVTFANHDFNDLLKALDAGTVDAVLSAMSDTREREKKVDFIDYFIAGSGILVPRGNPHAVFNLGGLCGLSVDMEKGTSQEAAVKAESNACAAVRLGPIAVQSFPTDADALKALTAGKTYAHISDYPVVAFLARTLGGGAKYEVAGKQFGVVPYGIAVAKANHDIRDALQAALTATIEDGGYDRLLKKWGLQQGAMRSAPVNAGTLFQ